ncbi:MAG TPA: hypothetical protein VF240_12625 [Pyrinomonadaceae bacterium]
MSRPATTLVIVILAFIAPVFASAAMDGRDDVWQSHQRARPAQGSEEVFITDIEMARDDGAGRGGQTVRSFRAKDNPLHCLVTLSRAQQGTRVGFVWTALDAGGKRDEAIASAEVVTGPREIVADSQLRHPREWPAGRYSVQATINGRAARTVEFTIN